MSGGFSRPDFISSSITYPLDFAPLVSSYVQISGLGLMKGKRRRYD